MMNLFLSSSILGDFLPKIYISYFLKFGKNIKLDIHRYLCLNYLNFYYKNIMNEILEDSII